MATCCMSAMKSVERAWSGSNGISSQSNATERRTNCGCRDSSRRGRREDAPPVTGRGPGREPTMNSLRKQLAASPLAARVAPFVLFAALTVGQGRFGESSRYWFYFVKTIMGAWLIWLVRPHVPEMRWKFSWAALCVGVAVFAMWVGIDPFYPPLDRLMRYVGLAKAGSETDSSLDVWN